ncbi:MAG: phage major capsid protein [Alphaproteobacteria bacterium]
MTVDVIALRQERGDHLAAMQTIIDKAEAAHRDVTAAELAEYDTHKAALVSLDNRIARAEDFEREKLGLARPVDGPDAGPRGKGPLFIDRASGRALRGLLPSEKLADHAERAGPRFDLADFGHALRAAVTGDWSPLRPEIRDTLREGVNTGGGFLVPDELSRLVIDLARAQSVVFQAGAITIPMTSDTLTIARLTADPVAAWVGENATIPDAEPTFGAGTLVARKLGILCKASNEVLDDAVNLGDIIVNSMASAAALELDRAVLYGITQPDSTGIRDFTGVGEVSMGTNGAALDDFSEPMDALQKIAAANGPVDNLVAVMHPRSWAALGKLEDSTGQPLRPPAAWERVRQLVSTQVPVTLTQGSSNVASDIIIGSWPEVMVAIRSALRIEISREAGAAFSDDQTWFRCILRAHWTLAHPGFFVRIVGVL